MYKADVFRKEVDSAHHVNCLGTVELCSYNIHKVVRTVNPLRPHFLASLSQLARLSFSERDSAKATSRDVYIPSVQ